MEESFTFRPHHITKIQHKGNNSPLPRSGHRIVADEANIFSFGGYSPTVIINHDRLLQQQVLFKQLWRFNLATGVWTKLKTKGYAPQQVASHTAVLANPYILVFGGTGLPFGRSNSNMLHAYNIKTSSWSEVATTGDHPQKQYGQALIMHDNKLYVVGGTSGFGYSIDVHSLDLETKSWKELYSRCWPEGRYRHEIAIYDNRIYVFGGGTAVDSYELSEIPVFDLERNQWESLVPLNSDNPNNVPSSRKCHGCVQMGEEAYIIGGYDGLSIMSDIWKFHLKKKVWTKLPYELPCPVYFHSVALSPNGQMFIFGGVTSIEENTRTNELYSVWLKIPKLEEICWLAVLHYHPQLTDMPLSSLFYLGIPKKFIFRFYCL